MSGGGGGQTVVQPSTTTTVQDIPAWEQGYVQDLLGQAQAIAAQPYQQFPGQQVAGFTPDQLQAFSNVQNAGAVNEANQNQAMGAATAGQNTISGIYGAGAGDINAATSYNPLAAVAPYLGAATQYNSATAAQPWLGQAAGYQAMAANVATPGGIQSYMSPYTNSVVQGLQDEANLNWNQNIMPGINDKFVGSGQYGSGRNAQVLGQAAGNFQTGLSSNIANALESGYNTAGTQAANQANLLSGLGNQSLTGANTASSAQGTQISNLLNQANAAGTSTQQQAANLLGQGTALGNLASTQGTQQLNAANTIGNLGAQAANTNLTQNQALQATGQQQQQLNQTNLNTAMQNWQNQVNWPAQQTEYLNQIIRGLPAPTASTTAAQTPAYSVSPLAGIGGAGTAALSLIGSNGQSLGSAVGQKEGGLIKGYAEGGQVDEYSDDDSSQYDDMTPLDYADNSAPQMSAENVAKMADLYGVDSANESDVVTPTRPLDAVATPAIKAPINPLAPPSAISPAQTQQLQLLSLARGMLTPQMNGSALAALGQGIGNLEDTTLRTSQMKAQQDALNYQRQLEAQRIGIEKQSADQRGDYYKGMVANRDESNAIKLQLAQERAKSGGNPGVTERLIHEYMLNNPDATWNDAYAAVKRSGSNNEDMNNIRKETLAQNAYKNGISIKGNPNPTIDDYRAMYGLKPKPLGDLQVNAPAPTGIKPTQTDIDYLKKNPDMASRFEGRFGAGTAAQYLGQ